MCNPVTHTASKQTDMLFSPFYPVKHQSAQLYRVVCQTRDGLVSIRFCRALKHARALSLRLNTAARHAKPVALIPGCLTHADIKAWLKTNTQARAAIQALARLYKRRRQAYDKATRRYSRQAKIAAYL